MAIEHDVAQYIAAYTGLALGTDIFAQAFPADVKYGIYIRVLDEDYEYGKLNEAIIGCFVTKDNYYDARVLALQIKDALIAMRGYNGWASGGKASITNLGRNVAGDEMFVVTATIYNNS